MENRYLLVVRAGDQSLHRAWLPVSGETRQWDLHISYFGEKDEPFGALPEGVTFSREPGPKFLGLAGCLENHPEFLERYERIGFPDDDLACSCVSWNMAFSILEESGAALGQPSLDPRSFYSYDIVLRRAWLKYREVNFVEVMCPIFTPNFLRLILPTWTLNRSSWGLDFLWREIARQKGETLAIVDAASVVHTRSIGRGAQYSVANMGGSSPLAEYEGLLAQACITDTSRRSLRGVRCDGSVVSDVELLNRRLKWAGLRRNWRKAFGVNSIAG